MLWFQVKAIFLQRFIWRYVLISCLSAPTTSRLVASADSLKPTIFPPASVTQLSWGYWETSTLFSKTSKARRRNVGWKLKLNTAALSAQHLTHSWECWLRVEPINQSNSRNCWKCRIRRSLSNCSNLIGCHYKKPNWKRFLRRVFWSKIQYFS